MRLFDKIRKHGIVGSIKVLGWHCSYRINNLLYYLCCIFKTNEQLIVFESEGDLSDNAFAFYDYLKCHGFLKKYKIVWLVDDLTEARTKEFENTVYVKKMPKTIELKRSFYLATCKWYIYDHCNLLENFYKRKECVVVNLWHGNGIKAGKGATITKSQPDYMNVTGKRYIEIQKQVFGYPRETFIDIGYPRNDYFYLPTSNKQIEFKNKFNLSNKTKVFLWMPTFRRSDNKILNEDYFCSETGMPIIDSIEKLKAFNQILADLNGICIFKLHHLQAELNVFRDEYSNIKVIRDEDLRKAEIQLYEMIPLTDCLITDYSSVATDYMLLDRPIIYTIDDYDEYKASRGFLIDDPKKFFAGHCVVDEEELILALKDIIEGNDRYREQRLNVLPETHTYCDGNTSKRLIEFLGI